MHMSTAGVSEQLVSEGFPPEAAQWAVDYNESATTYLEDMAMSRDELGGVHDHLED
ncbi:Ltp family lipoprotein [Corynebacterium sp. 13CS0277]|uniref:Ltp family lipoprotein n=1 Tax=Corynebacterium sp. 13CS0277 TaxID=2071994 RepID=UPI001E523C37|nr:Ltp family lipoprotein [Corynebacterium sp. 13CS0277]